VKVRKGKGGVATKGLFRDVALFAGLAAIASGYAYVRIEGTLAGYRLSAAQVEHHELLREREALQLELATRRAAGRIEADARERLGMVEPKPEDIIPVKAGPAPRPTVASTGTVP
jgi:cell division protein FtsL